MILFSDISDKVNAFNKSEYDKKRNNNPLNVEYYV